jgi:hypothetical protein
MRLFFRVQHLRKEIKMGVRESLLNTISSVGSSDFVRIVTAAGASSKATVANLFKSFESGLGVKSSLGTGDYIRVVGSDNASYKQLVSDVAKKIIENYTGSSLAGSSQSVKSALDSLNSKLTFTDITNTLSSSVATVNAAYSHRIGRVVVVQIRFPLTSAVTPATDVISGFDRSISNYGGVNAFRLYDNTAGEFVDALVTHPDGASSIESLRILGNVASGHSIRGTFMYIAVE